MKHLDLNTIGD